MSWRNSSGRSARVPCERAPIHPRRPRMPWDSAATGAGMNSVRVEQFPLAVLLACQVGGFACVSAVSEVIGAVGQSTSVIYRASVLAMSLLLVMRLLSGSVRVASSGVGLALAVLWAAMLARLVFDLGILGVQAPRAAGEYLLITVGACLIPMLAMFAAPRARTLEKAWVFSTVLCALASLAVAWLLLSGGVREWALRLATDVLNPITIGYLGASLVVLAVSAPPRLRVVSRVWRVCSPIVRVTLGTVGLLVAVASGSRGPMLALVLAFLVLGAMSSRRTTSVWLRRTVGLVTAAAAVVAGLWAMLALGQRVGAGVLERFLWLGADDSTDYRQQAIRGALRQFGENPLVGSSILERITMDYPHNLFVESLMATGLLGGIPLVIFLCYVAHSALVLIRDRPEARWLGMLCLMQLVASMTSGSLFLSDTFWTISVATLSAASRRTFRLVHRRGAHAIGSAGISPYGGVQRA